MEAGEFLNDKDPNVSTTQNPKDSRSNTDSLNHICQLPNELIEFIVDYVSDDKDFIAIRSTCRQISHAVDRQFNNRYFTVRRVAMSCLPSLRQLIDISKSPRSPAVKVLNLSFDFISVESDNPLYRAENWVVMRGILDQDHLRRTGKDTYMLAKALRGLTHIHKISALREHDLANSLWNRAIYRPRDSRSDDIQSGGPGEDEGDTDALGIYHCLQRCRSKFQVHEGSASMIARYLTAIVESGIKLNEFTLSMFRAGSEALYILDQEKSRYAQAFSQVKSLELVVERTWLTDENVAFPRWQESSKRFIRCFTGLEELRYTAHFLNFGNDHSAWECWQPYDQLWLNSMNAKAFPSLSRLFLHHVKAMSFKSISNVVNQLGSQLHVLSLQDIYLGESSPPPMVPQFAQLGRQCPKVNDICIERIYIVDDWPVSLIASFVRSDEATPSSSKRRTAKYRRLAFDTQESVQNCLAEENFNVRYHSVNTYLDHYWYLEDNEKPLTQPYYDADFESDVEFSESESV